MAPLEPSATALSNTVPLALFSGHILLVTGLTVHVLQTVYRAACSIPPTSSTRLQEPTRRRHAVVFSILALLSLATVTTFSVAWRILSYVDWAERGNHETPGSLWTGWYGTGEDGVGSWHLGDWISDVDLLAESDKIAFVNPEGFLYTSQHFVGLVAATVFMGVQGHRRNLPFSTIISFVVLSTFGSLAYALNLFFIVMLYTPLAQHSDESPRRDALFTPKAMVYCLPIVGSLLSLHLTPGLMERNSDITLLRFGYAIFPLFLAFAPQIIPLSWGHQHVSKVAAHRSFKLAFWTLSIGSFALHGLLLRASFFANTPPAHTAVYDLLKNAIGKQEKQSRLLTGIGNTAQKLKLVSRHPAISVTASDTLFTAISLCTWAFVRKLDVNDILDNSLLWFLSSIQKEEKHVAFKEDIKTATEEASAASSPTKKRGRPKKNSTITSSSTVAPASSTASLRRSARRKVKADYESDMEESFEPPAHAAREVMQTEADGTTVEDVVHGGESTAVALLLGFIGGLGQLAAGVLGAEVTGEPHGDE